MDKSQILIIEDDPTTARMMTYRLESADYSVSVIDNGEECMAWLKQNQPDLILLDVELPGLNGFEVCRLVRDSYPSPYIPIIMVTSHDDMESRISALDIGADDFLSKPFNPKELLARIRVSLRIKKMQDELRELSLRDELTGLYNRRFLNEIIDQLVFATMRYKTPLTITMIDIDNFKTINDTYGHSFGDFAIQSVSSIIVESCRKADVICRYGGDEFLLVTHNDIPGAYQLGDRISSNVQNHSFSRDGITMDITVSIGISTFSGEFQATTDELIKYADTALHESKRRGKNCVTMYPQEQMTAIEIDSSQMSLDDPSHQTSDPSHQTSEH